MQFEVDRTRDPAGEPSLSEMTASALELLQRHPAGRRRGFVLVVEAGRIDHAHHAGNAARALNDTIELSRAVAVAVERTDPRRTLILVTADHSHTLTIGGYSTRGNPILGLVVRNDDLGGPHSEPERATDGLPYTALGYANGAGARRDTGQRRDLSSTDTAAVDFIQDAAIPTRGETHAAEDVAVYAAGPGASLVHGVMEQNELYHVMAHALRLDAAPPGVLARLWRRLTGG
jgi:alkaline phosphatase